MENRIKLVNTIATLDEKEAAYILEVLQKVKRNETTIEAEITRLDLLAASSQ